MWLCANWLIQLRSAALIGSRVIYCQSDPRSLFRRRAKTTLLLLNMPLDWRTVRAAGNEIKWKNSRRCYRHWVNASYFAVTESIFFPGKCKTLSRETRFPRNHSLIQSARFRGFPCVYADNAAFSERSEKTTSQALPFDFIISKPQKFSQLHAT